MVENAELNWFPRSFEWDANYALLLQIGADVGGEIVNVSEDEEDDDGYSDDYDSDDEESLESDEEDDIIDSDDQDHGVDDTKVNLDITAMIAYVSAMTNGRYEESRDYKIIAVSWQYQHMSESSKRFFDFMLMICLSPD